MTPRHLLVVSYNHPPFPGPGGNRWLAMARYLREAGHTVTILASNAYGGLPDDGDLGVIRVSDLKSSRVLRGLLRRGELAPAAVAEENTGIELPAPAVLTKVVVPDAYVVSWLPAAVAAARRCMAHTPTDCLITSGPPESMHLTGLLLGRRRPAWVVDLRDGWSYEPLREPFPLRTQRRLDVRLERKVVKSADAITTVTDPITNDIRARYGVNAATVPNAYDPGLDVTLESEELPALPPGRLLLVHTGTLSGLRGRDPRPLVEALTHLSGDPDTSRLAFIQVGPISAEDETLLKPLRDRGLAHILGVVPRTTAIALQRRADALLLITSADVSQSTAKLYEYLAAGRPIIALADGNEAARIVRATNAGRIVPPGDVHAITAALRAVVSGELAREFAPHGIAEYTYPAPARTMEAIVERCIAVHGRRAGITSYRSFGAS